MKYLIIFLMTFSLNAKSVFKPKPQELEKVATIKAPDNDALYKYQDKEHTCFILISVREQPYELFCFKNVDKK